MSSLTSDLSDGDVPTLNLRDIRKLTLEGQISHSGLHVSQFAGETIYSIGNRPVTSEEDLGIVAELIASGKLVISEYRLIKA